MEVSFQSVESLHNEIVIILIVHAGFLTLNRMKTYMTILLTITKLKLKIIFSHGPRQNSSRLCDEDNGSDRQTFHRSEKSGEQINELLNKDDVSKN